ncbi:T9SS type A sorting domain-containing protein [Capnocytophaga sputigena]|uniref:T9SS type A sorting domain-containing protein n=1 Tax=Capnocytophaga sputigena TaxID=1019 RepID=UPI0028D78CFC|nr:T9SS type A sorting domain-containing protein [Capnocytophaga sputigena]
MKKFLLILIFLDYFISFGQDFSLGIDTNTKEKYKYLLLSKKFVLTAWRDDRDCGSLFYVQLNDKDIPIRIGNESFTRFEGFWSGTYYPEIKHPFDFEPKKIFIHGWFKDTGNFRSCDENLGANNAWINVKNEEPIDICKTGNIKGEDETEEEVSIASTLEFYILPLHTLKTSDNNSAKFLPIETEIPLIGKEGFNPDLYEFRYREFGKDWKTLKESQYSRHSRYDYPHTIYTSASKIFGAKAESMIGKTIDFQIVSRDKDNGNVCSSSNIIPLIITKSAPFIGVIDIKNPLCYSNEPTATFTVKLGRKLLGDLQKYKTDKNNYLGETLKITIQRKDSSRAERPENLPEEESKTTEYFLQHDRIENVVLHTASVTTDYTIKLKGNLYYLNSEGKRASIPLYSDHYMHSYPFTITVPQPLTAKAFPIDNRCFGDTQGKIEVRVLGGTPPYKYIKNGEPPVTIAGNFFSIENLASGVYTFTITDKNNCPMASDNPLVVNVWGPKMPITIMNENTDLVTNVTGSGRADGKIEPIVMGGTLYNYNKNQYIATLYSSKGEISYSKRDLLSVDNDIPKYRYVYENLEAGTYTFTVRDYYDCAIMKEITITEPPLLTASISATTTIGCNQNNNDPNNHYELYNNGVLSATVEGGVPPYKYFWKKLGRRVPLQGNDKPIIRGLSKGTYQLFVTDENDDEVIAFYTLTEPPQLMLSVTKSEMTCSVPNGGQATAIASGGTPPYTYLWNTGHSGAHITGLSAGKYFVTVSDSRGCSVQEKVVLSYPEEVEVNNAIITPVTCYEGNDGKIALTLSGGKGTINISWYDAQGNLLSQRITNGGKTINGLKAGKYKAVFRDQSDCPALEQFYEVLQPEKTVINIPSQITICQGDSRSFDLSTAFPSATFRWTDSTGTLLSTEPTFAVSAKGIYKVEITDQKGCRESTTFEVLQSDKVLEVDFLAATNAYYNYTVKLINLSHSITTQWVLPQEVTLIKEENGGAEVRFPKEGTYTIGLKGFLDGCEKTIYKTLWVEKDRLGIGKENSFKEVVIDDFKIVDNPNNGTFRIEVKLKKPAAIKIYGMDILGQMVISPIEQPESTTFNIPVSNSGLSGQYLIILEAGGDVMVQKMIVNH